MFEDPRPISMPSDQKPFELKADSFSFPTLYLLSNDIEAINESLERQVAKAPNFFLHAPLVFDLSRLPEACTEVDFSLLVGMTRGQGMTPTRFAHVSCIAAIR